jgi:hypothetical protein
MPSSGGSAADVAIAGSWRMVPSDASNIELPFAIFNLLILTIARWNQFNTESEKNKKKSG